ncbi:MAG: beta-ketoacyl synthase N-terminal-like domain-containing protein, partial [Terriglobales bacterium]
VPQFDAAAVIRNPKLLRSMQRTFQLGTVGAVEAMQAAGLNGAAGLAQAGFAPERAGVATALDDISPLSADLLAVLAAASDATGAIAWDKFAELGLHRLHPFRRLTLLANMAAAHTSLLVNLQGPSFTFTSGAEAGAQALQQACWTIAEGHADWMVCHAASTPMQAFRRQPGPELAGAVVLENAAMAERRGAPLLATVTVGPATAAPSAGVAAAGLLEALLRIGQSRSLNLDRLLGAEAAPALEKLA